MMNTKNLINRPYVLQQISTDRKEEILIPAASRMNPRLFRRVLRILRSSLEENESRYEDCFLYCPGGAQYYFCMERYDNGGSFNHWAEVWGCNMQDMETRSLSDDKHIVLISEVLG